jgi:hypothetical protein
VHSNTLLECHLIWLKGLRLRLVAGEYLDVKSIRSPDHSELGKRLKTAEMLEHRFTHEYIEVVEALDNFLLVASVLASIANNKSAEVAVMVFKQSPQYRETSVCLSQCINNLSDCTNQTKATSRVAHDWLCRPSKAPQSRPLRCQPG